MSNLIKQLGKESLIYGISGMLNKFIAVFLVPVYTTLFTPPEFGLQGLVVAVINLASLLAVMGLDSAAGIWYWATEDESDRRRTVANWYWMQAACATVLAGFIFLFAGQISDLLVGNQNARSLLRIAAWTLPLNVTHLIITNWFRLKRRAVATTCYTIASNLTLIGLTMGMIIVGKLGTAGVFLAQVSVGALTTLVGAFILRKNISPLLVCSKRIKEMMRYALPLVPAALAFWCMGLVDRIFIEKFADTSEVGVYNLAAALASMVALVTGAFSTAWGPFALSMQRKPGANEFYARILILYLSAGGCIVAGIALFAPEAVLIVSRPAYAGAAPVAGVLAIGVLANGLSYVAATGLALIRVSSPVALAVFISASINIVLNLVFIPVFGKEGAAWVDAVSWITYTGFIFLRAQRLYYIPYKFGSGLLLGALMVAVVVLAPALRLDGLWPRLALKAAVYAAVVAGLGYLAVSTRLRVPVQAP